MSDTPAAGDPTATPARPLNARSIALSTLLGTHPPSLPASSLVGLAELFGINGGTMRTALSRLVAAGDVELDDGRYTLSERLRARQAAQDSGRRAAISEWNGHWHTAVATVEQRDLADRRLVRGLMANHRFGELRPTVWMRPANLAPPRLDDDWVVVTGPLTGTDPELLAHRLWSMDRLAERATSLGHHVAATLDDIGERPSDAPPELIAPTFSLAAEVLRFLRSEPLLPPELTPGQWPVDRLRSGYDRLEAVLQTMMRPFLVVPRANGPTPNVGSSLRVVRPG